MATGLGKTVMFAHLPQSLNVNGRWLVLAHREELLDQAYEKFTSVNPSLTVGVEQAHRKAGDAQIVIASVQTMQKDRLKSFNPDEFSVIICDEAHHSVAKSYKNVFEYFGLGVGTGKILVGVTATPKRGDDVGLSEVYDDIAFEFSLQDGIEQGWLCDIVGKRIETSSDISNVKKRMGDFVLSQLAEAVDSPQRNQLIVESYFDLAINRKALVFCVNVSHAESLHEAFLDGNIRSSIVTGKTPKKERKESLRRFCKGDYSVMCNCGVLTEGFDDPEVSCIVMARPTDSSALYTQIIGRGTRLKEGPQKDCLVLDFTDNCKTQQIQTLPTLFGLPPRLIPKNVITDKEEIEEFQMEYPWINLDELKSVDQLKSVAKDIKFFRVEPPFDIRKFTKFQWMKIAEGFRLNLPNNEKLEVCPTRMDTFQIFAVAGDSRELIDERRLLREAVRAADDFVKKVRKKSVKLLDLKREWRSEKVTSGQLAWLKRLKVDYPKEINRGQAAAIISMRR
jgi:hypothetical protein